MLLGGARNAALSKASRVRSISEVAAPAQAQPSASKPWSFTASSVALSRSRARSAAVKAARSGSSFLSAAMLRSHLASRCGCRLAIELDRVEARATIFPRNHAIFAARGLDRDITVADILDHAHRIALERVAPAAAAGAANDRARLGRHLIPIGVDGLPIILARQAHESLGLAAGLAAPQAPGRHTMAAGLGQVPAPSHEIAHLHIEAEPAAELASAARIGAHLALLDDDRETLLQRFDRAVAHIALADRARRR